MMWTLPNDFTPLSSIYHEYKMKKKENQNPNKSNTTKAGKPPLVNNSNTAAESERMMMDVAFDIYKETLNKSEEINLQEILESAGFIFEKGATEKDSKDITSQHIQKHSLQTRKKALRERINRFERKSKSSSLNEGISLSQQSIYTKKSASSSKSTVLLLNQEGKGSSGTVYGAVVENDVWAVKVTKGPHSTEPFFLKRFIGDSFVIQMLKYDYNADIHTTYMTMERGTGNLREAIKHKKAETIHDKYAFLCYTWRNILKCIKSVHGQGVAHRDVKPENFVYGRCGQLKVIDFGIAVDVAEVNPDPTASVPVEGKRAGTQFYMSPESMACFEENGKPYVMMGKPSDIWSLGIMLLEMVHLLLVEKSTIYKKQDEIRTRYQIEERLKDIEGIEGIKSHDILKINNILNKCLREQASSRPTIQELIDQVF